MIGRAPDHCLKSAAFCGRQVDIRRPYLTLDIRPPSLKFLFARRSRSWTRVQDGIRALCRSDITRRGGRASGGRFPREALSRYKSDCLQGIQPCGPLSPAAYTRKLTGFISSYPADLGWLSERVGLRNAFKNRPDSRSNQDLSHK